MALSVGKSAKNPYETEIGNELEARSKGKKPALTKTPEKASPFPKKMPKEVDEGETGDIQQDENAIISDLSNNLDALGSALSSGDLQAAQSAYDAVCSTFDQLTEEEKEEQQSMGK